MNELSRVSTSRFAFVTYSNNLWDNFISIGALKRKMYVGWMVRRKTEFEFLAFRPFSLSKSSIMMKMKMRMKKISMRMMKMMMMKKKMMMKKTIMKR